jgi:hypothetical protein
MPGELSLGTQQCVSLARALVVEPRFLLLDEPFSQLDSLTRFELQDLLLRVWESSGKTVIMVTHDIDEALYLADHLVLMTDGPEATVGDVYTVPFARPAEPRGRAGAPALPRGASTRHRFPGAPRPPVAPERARRRAREAPRLAGSRGLEPSRDKNPITQRVRRTDGGPGRKCLGPFLEDAMKRLSIQLLAGAVFVAAAGLTAIGSSHREAPGITGRPKLDGTDFYAFRSYEPGREGYVTLIANYIPLQDAYGGPNFFAMDPNGLYEIHVDNDGDAKEDITFQFRFKTTYRNLAVDAGGRSVTIPLVNIGPIGPNAGDNGNLNAVETYQVTMVRGPRRGNPGAFLRDASTNSRIFRKPADRIGDKSIPNYAQYANQHIYDVTIPGCGNGRVFAGQRREGFVVNLAEAFDLINLNPLGPVDGRENVLADKNVTSLALEVPIRLPGRWRQSHHWCVDDSQRAGLQRRRG